MESVTDDATWILEFRIFTRTYIARCVIINNVLRLPRHNGIAALPIVLVVGGIITSIAIVLAVVAISGSSNSLNLRAGNDALFVARAGANDEVLRVVNNKDFSSSGYTMPLDSKTAQVTVTRSQPVAGETTIVSTATVLGRQRTVKLIVSIDSLSGEVSTVSLDEI